MSATHIAVIPHLRTGPDDEEFPKKWLSWGEQWPPDMELPDCPPLLHIVDSGMVPTFSKHMPESIQQVIRVIPVGSHWYYIGFDTNGDLQVAAQAPCKLVTTLVYIPGSSTNFSLNSTSLGTCQGPPSVANIFPHSCLINMSWGFPWLTILKEPSTILLL